MKKHRKSRGYILVTTVLLIAITGLLLAGVARRSLLSALAVKQAQDDLQTRWGQASCQRLVFNHAPAILTRRIALQDSNHSDPRSPGEPSTISIPIPSRLAVIELGGIVFHLQVADEQAKANLNRLLLNRSDETVIGIMRRLDRAGDQPTIHFRKNKNFDLSPRKASFGSWGQVFEPTGAAGLLPAEQIRLTTERLTLWGPGWNLHFAAAEDEVLAEIARLAVNPIAADKLVELRAESPAASLEQILDSMELNASKRSALESLLVESSRCYSLWITSQDNSGAVNSKLVVRDTYGEATQRIHVWVW